MNLLYQVRAGRHEFLRQQLTPNRLLVPHELRHQLIGEVADIYPSVFTTSENLHIEGLRVVYTNEVKRIEVALVMEKP